VQEFGAIEHAPPPVVMDEYNSDWDSLYPFSNVRLVSVLHR